mmetsp:Transcript_20839/g.58471  ORF Transcript_20839/g.58471 Transcript_20839/m.58471 type:complete len:105 (+) Transcript_20839:1551-1865(+)
MASRCDGAATTAAAAATTIDLHLPPRAANAAAGRHHPGGASTEDVGEMELGEAEGGGAVGWSTAARCRRPLLRAKVASHRRLNMPQLSRCSAAAAAAPAMGPPD